MKNYLSWRICWILFHQIDFECIFGLIIFNKNNCGTSACAGGWATTLFPQLYTLNCEVVYFKKHLKEKFYGLDALSKFFDIDLNTAYNIFMGNAYESYKKSIFGVSPTEVSKRIRGIVNAETSKSNRSSQT